MSDCTETLSYGEIFNEIAEECRKNFPDSEKIKPNKKQPKYCRLQPTAIHYELQHYDLANMIGIEIHIEKESYNGKNDYEAKKEKVELLQKSLKYFTDVKIFDKHIMYYPCWYNCGKIYILCDYSMGKKRILSYIDEFIYQTKERIDIIAPNWNLSC